MQQLIAKIALVVKEYDEAIHFYTQKLDFKLVEDTQITQEKRWVVIAPPGDGQTHLLLARAANEQQRSRVGNQTGGRVFLFLFTDNIERDYQKYKTREIEFVRELESQPHGRVAVFKDLYGNLWDLIEPSDRNSLYKLM